LRDDLCLNKYVLISSRQTSVERLKSWYPKAIQVHTQIHAIWPNQVEIYFSVLQRKVLTPNDFERLEELESRFINFQIEYEIIAKPFEWKFIREDLKNLLSKFDDSLKLAA